MVTLNKKFLIRFLIIYQEILEELGKLSVTENLAMYTSLAMYRQDLNLCSQCNHSLQAAEKSDPVSLRELS